MHADNARRLTGRSLFAIGESGACVDLTLQAGESFEASKTRALALFQSALERLSLLDSFWDLRPFANQSGFSLAIGGAIDGLYPLADFMEWLGEQLGQESSSDEAALTGLPELWASWVEANPHDPYLLAAQAVAKAQDLPFLWDEDEVSFGYGKGCVTVTRAALAEGLPDLSQVTSLPLVMITGTNGKTTTTRMLGRILKAHGWKVGATSTDGLTVDGELVDPGDWTGPVGAKTILRRTDIDAAILEVARGGLLRRGLAVPKVDCAVVTNVDDDHLGDYGITSVDAMAEVKALVWKTATKGIRVLNVEDARLVKLAQSLGFESKPQAWTLYGRDSDNAVLEAHIARGGRALSLEDETLVVWEKGQKTALLTIAEMPSALGGAAWHNVANALCAASVAASIGVASAAIIEGLKGFGVLPSDNPGRLERYHVLGKRLVCDFAHNPHGIAAVTPALEALRKPGTKLWVSIAQAGDRSQEDLEQLVAKSLVLKPTELSVRLLGGYERGRPLQDVVDILCQAAIDQGFPAEAIVTEADEPTFLARALEAAGPDDLVALLVHCERAEVREFLQTHGATPMTD